MVPSKSKLKINGDKRISLFQTILKRKCVSQMSTYSYFSVGSEPPLHTIKRGRKIIVMLNIKYLATKRKQKTLISTLILPVTYNKIVTGIWGPAIDEAAEHRLKTLRTPFSSPLALKLPAQNFFKYSANFLFSNS
jgi:hypothetical protein